MNAPSKSNMGRCDICGKPIDLEAGQKLTVSDGGLPDDEGFWDSLANHLERQGKPADYTLAEAFREQHGYKAHRSCMQGTSWPKTLDQMDEAARDLEDRGVL